MHDPSGDLAAPARGAASASGSSTGLDCDFTMLGELQAALRKGEWKVTVAVHDASQVIALWPGFHEQAPSASRSTSARRRSRRTCATSRPARWSPPPGTMNPQIRFGEDLMSRVSYAMMNPGGAAR